MRQVQMAKQRQHQLNQPQLVEIQVKAFHSQSEQVQTNNDLLLKSEV